MKFNIFDRFIRNINEYSLIRFLSISLGIAYFWFGMLKYFPGASPAQELATTTINKLFFGLIPKSISMYLLATWEVFIGLSLLLGKFIKPAIYLLLIHMILTFTPLFLLVDICFSDAPLKFSIVGQYIVKNITFIAGGLMIYRYYLKNS